MYLPLAIRNSGGMPKGRERGDGSTPSRRRVVALACPAVEAVPGEGQYRGRQGGRQPAAEEFLFINAKENGRSSR